MSKGLLNNKVVGILGYPIGHTLSPLFQNAAFKASGIKADYVVFEVEPKDLKDALTVIRSPEFLGVNLTIPHKEKAILFLDKISTMAKKCGSVNTVVNQNGKLRGETTDGLGFILSLKEAGVAPEKKRILLAGAGGAARSVAFALAETGADIYLTNRTVEKGEKLVSDLKDCYPRNTVVYIPFSEKSDALRRKKIDILINATSVGLTTEEELFRPKDLTEKLIVCDLIYNRQTLLLRSAQKLGLKTVDGLGMLIHQGALSFRLWTGKTAPIKKMFAAVK
ncbi:MAG: shikimate dehydrogenase [Candidatus Ratteibacteria bacterium]|jgi:shikimate dehydrogenase